MNEELRKRKVVYLLLAFLIAVALWAYVDEFGNDGKPYETQVTISDIPISYVGEESLADRGLMLVLDEDTDTSLDLTLSGGRRRVVALGRDDIRVTVNLSNVEQAGVQTVTPNITSTHRNFSKDLIAAQDPAAISVNIKELNRKTVEIRCELVGELAEGCSAGELQLSQTTLELRGQAEDIDPVAYAKVTLDIGEGAAETVSEKLEFSYYDSQNQLIENSNIRPVTDTVQATLPVFVTKELALVVNFKEADGLHVSNLNYGIKPSTIMVSGDASVLNHVDSIVLGEFDLADLLDSGASSHTYPILIPEGCQNLSGVTRATLELQFKDMAKAKVTTDHFTCTGLPEGKQVNVLTQELEVTVFGKREAVAAVTGGDLLVEVDLSNYAAASGTYTLPATVTVTGGGDVGVTGTYQVQLSIHDQEPPETDPEPEESFKTQ